jgi:hypothetical protein
MLWKILLQVNPADGSRSSTLFVWINTHALSNTAFNVSPFFASAINASPNAHYAFFFSLPEIVYQTHCISLFCSTGVFLVWAHLHAPLAI